MASSTARVFVDATTTGLQSIARLEDPKLKGAVIRQESQYTEAVLQAAGLPLQVPNLYKISAMPEDKKVKAYPGDSKGWHPSDQDLKELDQLFFVREESHPLTNTFLTLIGMSSKRALKLHFIVKDGGEAFIVDRPFMCGGHLCQPFQMSLFRKYVALDQGDNSTELRSLDDPVLIGRIREDFDDYVMSCFRCCCLCTHRAHVEKAIAEGTEMKLSRQFLITANTSCCYPRGGANNCCGATCLRHDMVWVIYNTNHEVVGRVQKTYGGGQGCHSFCRMMQKFDNYIVEFPDGVTTAEDRMLILTSILHVDYQMFEEKGEGGD